MLLIKRFFKRNSHNTITKAMAGFGRALNRFYENRNHDIYSNDELIVLKKISKTNPKVIIDGGANVGNYALMVREFCPNATIYSFEPVKSTFEKLTANVEKYCNIIPVAMGLYKENCTKEINLYKSNTHSSLIGIQGLPYETTGKETIELVCGDEFIMRNNLDEVDFLKIDIEGAEFDALLGFEQTLKKGKIKAIQFEYGYINISTKILLIDYYDFFEKHGYVIGKIFPKIVEFRKYNFIYEDFLGPNFIAVKESENNLIDLLSHK